MDFSVRAAIAQSWSLSPGRGLRHLDCEDLFRVDRHRTQVVALELVAQRAPRGQIEDRRVAVASPLVSRLKIWRQKLVHTESWRL